ncbi:DUF6328 family protein [Fodinicola acaciae]|uniref:DUF6328 family protein n=1 Tax=Fodinicola acaciae TaxID=2681555 RepID=UPI0013D25A2A|nr:DUF6328 family protein [Fodinicola acaciae]
MTETRPTPENGYGRNETPAQRADRNFVELLQELRVAQTGIQILFAFLLTIPFQARFSALDAFQRGTYVVTLLLCAVATALLIAPVPYHRALFGKGRKAAVVTASNRLAGAGLAVMLAAISCGILLIMDVVLGRVVGIAAGLVAAGWFGLLWYVLPRRFSRRPD